MKIMTNPIFFDTDCLSSFLKIKEQRILEALYSGRIMITQQVFSELEAYHSKVLVTDAEILVNRGIAFRINIEPDTEIESKYLYFVYDESPKGYQIGKGEASILAFASAGKGIVASNNLRDVAKIVKDLKIPLITTAEILVEATEKSVISQVDAESHWAKMIRCGDRLPFKTFVEYKENRINIDLRLKK